uniref:Uncharacterized protein n=1 Tax=Vespula pensylvanica TaxID=30213 RepID=A0A834K0B9_VESPE|nr:hypothetical protein H0235_016027 [Vespula pensylvanica]
MTNDKERPDCNSQFQRHYRWNFFKNLKLPKGHSWEESLGHGIRARFNRDKSIISNATRALPERRSSDSNGGGDAAAAAAAGGGGGGGGGGSGDGGYEGSQR